MYWMVTLGLFDTLDRTYPVSTERDIYKLMHFSIPTLSGVFPVDKHFFHSAAPQYWWSKFFTLCSEANKCPAIQRPGPSFWRSGYWSQEVRSFLGHYCYKRFISWCCGETLSINRNYLTCLQIVKDYILIRYLTDFLSKLLSHWSFCFFVFQVTVFQVVMDPGQPDNFNFTVDSSVSNVIIYITFTLTSSAGSVQRYFLDISFLKHNISQRQGTSHLVSALLYFFGSMEVPHLWSLLFAFWFLLCNAVVWAVRWRLRMYSSGTSHNFTFLFSSNCAGGSEFICLLQKWSNLHVSHTHELQ